MANIAVGMRSRSRNESRYNNAIERKESETRSGRKEYKASSWAREMINSAKNMEDSSGKFTPSGHFLSELDKKGGLQRVPDHAKEELTKKTYDISQGKE